MSVDPLGESYAYQTVYSFASNQPVHAKELEGLESEYDLNGFLIGVADQLPNLTGAGAAYNAISSMIQSAENVTSGNGSFSDVLTGPMQASGLSFAVGFVETGIQALQGNEYAQGVGVVQLAEIVITGSAVKSARMNANTVTNEGSVKIGTQGGDRAGKSFTSKGKQEVINQNKAKNGGVTACEDCDVKRPQGQKEHPVLKLTKRKHK